MKRAGMLLRVSTLAQEDNYSLPDQERHSRDHAAKMGYTIDERHIWNDGAQKSYTLNRPGLKAAIEAVRKGEIDVLVTARYDRLSRVQLQQAVVIYEVEQLYGGKVESADPREQFGEGSAGALLRSIHAWRAEQERELITLRTQGGRKARAQSGKLIPTRFPLYGYLWADPDAKHGKTRYIIDPETAPIVQRIFADALRGIPMRRIANESHQRGCSLSL